MIKGLKLKVRKLCELIRTFVEVAGEKLVGGHFLPPPPILNRVKRPCSIVSESNHTVEYFKAHLHGLRCVQTVQNLLKVD